MRLTILPILTTALAALIFTSDAMAMYHARQGRFIQRDPAGYRDGASLYSAYSQNPVQMSDPRGLYPGLPGHGDMISPESSVNLLKNTIRRADAKLSTAAIGLTIELELDPNNADDRKRVFYRFLTQNRFAFLQGNNYIGTNEKNRFVYTCEKGWIDHGHFFRNTYYTYFTGNGATGFLGSGGVEVLQAITGSGSAWAPEDLISNRLGRDFGRAAVRWDEGIWASANLSLERNGTIGNLSKSHFYDISGRWSRKLRDWGAVKLGTGFTIGGSTVEEILRADIDEYAGNSSKGVRPSVKSIESGLDWHRQRTAYSCLCDGDNPIDGQIQY